MTIIFTQNGPRLLFWSKIHSHFFASSYFKYVLRILIQKADKLTKLLWFRTYLTWQHQNTFFYLWFQEYNWWHPIHYMTLMEHIGMLALLQVSVTAVVEFWGQGSTESRVLLKTLFQTNMLLILLSLTLPQAIINWAWF